MHWPLSCLFCFALLLGACNSDPAQDAQDDPVTDDSPSTTGDTKDDCNEPEPLPSTPLTEDELTDEGAALQLQHGTPFDQLETTWSASQNEVKYHGFTVKNTSDEPQLIGAIGLSWWHDDDEVGLFDPADEVELYLTTCHLEHIEGNRRVSEVLTIEPGTSNADVTEFDLSNFGVTIMPRSEIYLRPVCTTSDYMGVRKERLTYELPGNTGGRVMSSANSYRVITDNGLPRARDWVQVPWRDPSCPPNLIGTSNLGPHAQVWTIAWPAVDHNGGDVIHGQTSTSDHGGVTYSLSVRAGCGSVTYRGAVITFTTPYQNNLAMTSSRFVVRVWRQGEDPFNAREYIFEGTNQAEVFFAPDDQVVSEKEVLYVQVAEIDADTDHLVDDPNMWTPPGSPGVDHLTENYQPFHIRLRPAWHETGNPQGGYPEMDDDRQRSTFLIAEMSHD